MPYEEEARRRVLQKLAEELGEECVGAEDLEYVFTIIAHNWLHKKGITTDNMRLVKCSLDITSEEFYRRIMVPRQTNRMIANGDITLSNGTKLANLVAAGDGPPQSGINRIVPTGV